MSIDLSLDRIQTLLRHFPYTRPTVHIAGTNGKGSVSSFVSSILLAASISVGKFNSPHLVSILDSITVDGQSVSDDVYGSARASVEAVNEKYSIEASNFEVLTCTALTIFERTKVDIVVLEVGMGGRLDATNAIPDTCVLVSALTAVDLDHQAFLGSTIGQISREKASIARKGKAFVLGPQKHDEVGLVVKQVVGDVGAYLVTAVAARTRAWNAVVDGPQPPAFSLDSLHGADEEFQGPPYQPVEFIMTCFEQPVLSQLPLFGSHQLDNLGTAATIIDTLVVHPSCAQRLSLRNKLTSDLVSRGIRATVWPGRLSFHTIPRRLLPAVDRPVWGTNPKLVVLADGAHNPASASTLATYISQLVRTKGAGGSVYLTYILALSHSPPKTPLQTLSPLFSLSPPVNTQIHYSAAVLRFSPVAGMPWVQSVPPSTLAQVIKDLAPDADVWSPPDGQDSTQEGLKQALRWVSQKRHPQATFVVLAGSLYLVADLYRLLKENIET